MERPPERPGPCWFETEELLPARVARKYEVSPGQRFGKLEVTRGPIRGYGAGVTEKIVWQVRCDCGQKTTAGPKGLLQRGIDCCSYCDEERKQSRIEAELNKAHLEKFPVSPTSLPGQLWNTIKHGAKSRGLDVQIDEAYAIAQFHKQDGRCALSGVTLQLWFWLSKGPPASLDRIDSTLGYIPGNVQWVERDLNRMKWAFPQDKFVELCRGVARHFDAVPPEGLTVVVNRGECGVSTGPRIPACRDRGGRETS